MNTLDDILNYCSEKNPVGALLLTGPWGCGKTYLITNELASNPEFINKYHLVRVSLFGIDNISELHSNVKSAYINELLFHGNSNLENTVNKTKSVIKCFTKYMSKMEDAVNNVVSFNALDFIEVTNKISEKPVILVFDDIERCKIEIDLLLGCINQYIENKQINTIIIANEEKIIENNRAKDKEKDEKIDKETTENLYNMMKEKVISRTVKYQPNYNDIIKSIIESYRYNHFEYYNFLNDNIYTMSNIFTTEASGNIRSLKCALQDYMHIDKFVKENQYEINKSALLSTFISLVLLSKSNKINNNTESRYGWYNEIHKATGILPHYVDRTYCLPSIFNWIINGIWNYEHLKRDFDDLFETKTITSPELIICNNFILELDESTLCEGFEKALNLAYCGHLTLNQYTQLLMNIIYARTTPIQLPCEIDYQKYEEGLNIYTSELIKLGHDDSRFHIVIGDETSAIMNEYETNIYNNIKKLRDTDFLIFEKNRQDFLLAFTSKEDSKIIMCENKAYKALDRDMANAILYYYKSCDNSKKRHFNLSTMKSLLNYFELNGNKEINLNSLQYLVSELYTYAEEQKSCGNFISAENTSQLIKKISEVISELGQYNT